MTWVLVLFVHAGMMSNADSMAITNITGFTSERECQQEGERASRLTSRTQKDVRFICLKQTKETK